MQRLIYFFIALRSTITALKSFTFCIVHVQLWSNIPRNDSMTLAASATTMVVACQSGIRQILSIFASHQGRWETQREQVIWIKKCSWAQGNSHRGSSSVFCMLDNSCFVVWMYFRRDQSVWLVFSAMGNFWITVVKTSITWNIYEVRTLIPSYIFPYCPLSQEILCVILNSFIPRLSEAGGGDLL